MTSRLNSSKTFLAGMESVHHNPAGPTESRKRELEELIAVLCLISTM